VTEVERRSEPPPSDAAGRTAPCVVVRLDARAADVAGLPDLGWIPAETARRVAFASSTATLAEDGGIALGLALVEGRLVTLVGLGGVGPRAPIVLCARPDGDLIALAVDTIVSSGRFDLGAEGETVQLGDEIATRIDVDALVQRLEAAFWIADAVPERLSIVPRSRTPGAK